MTDTAWTFQIIFGILQAFFVLALTWLIMLIRGIEKDHNQRLESHHKRISTLERSTDVDIANLKHYRNMLHEISEDVKGIKDCLSNPKFFERCPNRQKELNL